MPPASRDADGRALGDYPRPSVAVDTAVLTVEDGVLRVVLVESGGDSALPGTFLHEGELLTEAVRRSLADKASITGLDPQQLRVFDALERDDRGRVLSIAHIAVVRSSAFADRSRLRLTPVTEAIGLRWDHDQIVRIAVERLRADHLLRPDPAALLDDEFTLRELQRLHETVAGRPLMKDAFRRRMEGLLVPTGRVSTGTMGKPARLWRRRPESG